MLPMKLNYNEQLAKYLASYEQLQMKLNATCCKTEIDIKLQSKTQSPISRFSFSFQTVEVAFSHVQSANLICWTRLGLLWYLIKKNILIVLKKGIFLIFFANVW